MSKSEISRDDDSGFDYRGFGHRLRVTRIALGLTEKQAAAAAGRTVHTWRKYEAAGHGYITGPLVLFCSKYKVPLDWIFDGDAAHIPSHLAQPAQGSVAIFPTKGWSVRRAQRVGGAVMTRSLSVHDNVVQLKRPPAQSQYQLYPLPFFDGYSQSTWTVQPTGNYSDDCETGRAYATAFLQSCDGTVGWTTLLPQIVGDMIRAGPSGTWPDGRPKINGVVIGFMSAIGDTLTRV